MATSKVLWSNRELQTILRCVADDGEGDGAARQDQKWGLHGSVYVSVEPTGLNIEILKKAEKY